MLCRPQSIAKTQSKARVKAVGQARRQRACGEFEGQRPSIGEADKKRQTKQVGRTKQ